MQWQVVAEMVGKRHFECQRHEWWEFGRGPKVAAGMMGLHQRCEWREFGMGPKVATGMTGERHCEWQRYELWEFGGGPKAAAEMVWWQRCE